MTCTEGDAGRIGSDAAHGGEEDTMEDRRFRKAIGPGVTPEEYRRRYHRTRAEELANGLTHLGGTVFAVLGSCRMLLHANWDVWRLGSGLAYGMTLILLTFSSALYHLTVNYRLKRLFQFMDHCTIYFLLAGTFTPVALVTMGHDAWGWTFFGAEWGLLAAGLLIECRHPKLAGRLSLYVYLFMGWITLAFMPRICQAMEPAGLKWLIWGGVAYTSGVVFFLMDRTPYMHTVWHLFVLAGILCHWICIMDYVICPC